ncbi:hypothetical protein ACR77J_08080 [Tissierella praeacuta]|uniref:hypothetical protein n=1 Tax=Tissierella praeacuta TaxID=43131 RepID=UPI003DA35EBC
MGRFEKLNDDIQALADKILEDQELCKLIHYPENNPLDQPDINGQRHILNKRLLLFTPKIPMADTSNNTQDNGTYITIRPTRLRPTNGGYYIVSLLCFDIYCHKNIRPIYYVDENGIKKNGDRAILIMDRIEKFMDGIDLSIGKNNLDGIIEIMNSNATFSGYTLGYKDVEFRK